MNVACVSPLIFSKYFDKYGNGMIYNRTSLARAKKFNVDMGSSSHSGLSAAWRP